MLIFKLDRRSLFCSLFSFSLVPMCRASHVICFCTASAVLEDGGYNSLPLAGGQSLNRVNFSYSYCYLFSLVLMFSHYILLLFPLNTGLDYLNLRPWCMCLRIIFLPKMCRVAFTTFVSFYVGNMALECCGFSRLNSHLSYSYVKYETATWLSNIGSEL